jgi:tight adherence protein B
MTARRHVRLLAGVAALAAAAVALLPGAAYAEGGRITQIETTGGKLNLVFAAGALPDGATVDPASVKVTVGGSELPATATLITGGGVARSAELVIDTSQSMTGEGIAGAKAAALAFVDGVPEDVRIGLVSFADQATVRVAPTTDRGAVRTAVAALRPAGKTSLYDGVLAGLRELGTTGARTLLVLSDGADTSSTAKLPAVLTAVKGSGATADTVAFKTPGDAAAVLKQIAAAGGGRAISAARAGDIGAAFRQTARTIANQLAVTANLPPTVVGPVTVAVSAKAGDRTVTDEVLTTVLPPDAAPGGSGGSVRIDPGRWGGKGSLYLALLALFAALLAILALGFGALTPDRQTGRVRRRLSLYTLTGRTVTEAREPAGSGALGESGVARSAVELADRVVRQRDFEASIARRLEQGGSALKPAEWLLIHAGSTIGTTVLFMLLTGGRPLASTVGFVIGFGLPYGWLSFRANRRANLFLSQMPDTLQLLAGSLTAGYSLPQAVDAVVREGSQPIATEFGRAIIESRLGVPIEDALDNIATRMDSRDFGWVVMAIRIQREVGGNLAEVLGTVAQTMRERERVRRQVRVLSAEGRLSGWILGGLPPVFGLYLVLVRPEYIRILYTDPIGILLICIAALQFAVGVFWLRKVVQVEV